MKDYLSQVIIILLIVFAIPGYSCITFTKTSEGRTYVANNEDWTDPEPKISIEPSSEDKFGCIYFGFDFGSDFFNPQGGINDKGLVFDGMASDFQSIVKSSNKEYFDGNLTVEAMRTCESVDEVLELFDNYNLEYLENAQLMFIDKNGNSAVIEGDKVIHKKKNDNYQISTNFYLSQLSENDEIPCERYKLAEKMLNENDPIVLSFKQILSATHQEGDWGGTQYSQIYDLDKEMIYLYHFHDFDNVVKIDINEELTKGKLKLKLSSLFPPKFAYTNYKEEYISQENGKFINILKRTLNEKGLEKTIKVFKELRNKKRVIKEYEIKEDEINDLGYSLLYSGKKREAIEIFKLIVEEFSDSSNAYDSLAEAYMLNGNKELSIENYKKSLLLNTENKSAKENIRKMEKEKL